MSLHPVLRRAARIEQQGSLSDRLARRPILQRAERMAQIQVCAARASLTDAGHDPFHNCYNCGCSLCTPYWAALDALHQAREINHNNEDAIKCIEDAAAFRSLNGTLYIEPGEDRDRFVIERRHAGETITQIAGAIGVNTERARQIVMKIERAQRKRRLSQRPVVLLRRLSCIVDDYTSDEIWTQERQAAEAA